VKTQHSVSVVVARFSLSSISCTTRVRIDDVVRGFFGEVNRSNFETAKTKYLAASLINDFNTPAALGGVTGRYRSRSSRWQGALIRSMSRAS
jgi:hypothetical protein